jgi:hypothetical protein
MTCLKLFSRLAYFLTPLSYFSRSVYFGMHLARPKSHSLTLHFELMRILALLISRWIMPTWWIELIAHSILYNIAMIWGSLRLTPLFIIYLKSDSMYSRTMNKWSKLPSLVWGTITSISYVAKRLFPNSVSLRRIRISRCSFRREYPDLMLLLISFTATTCPVFLDFAILTSPKDPSPRGFMILYLFSMFYQ